MSALRPLVLAFCSLLALAAATSSFLPATESRYLETAQLPKIFRTDICSAEKTPLVFTIELNSLTKLLLASLSSRTDEDSGLETLPFTKVRISTPKSDYRPFYDTSLESKSKFALTSHKTCECQHHETSKRSLSRTRHRMLMEKEQRDPKVSPFAADGTINNAVVVGAQRYMEKHGVLQGEANIVIIEEDGMSSRLFYLAAIFIFVGVLGGLFWLLERQEQVGDMAASYAKKYATDIDFSDYVSGSRRFLPGSRSSDDGQPPTSIANKKAVKPALFKEEIPRKRK